MSSLPNGEGVAVVDARETVVREQITATVAVVPVAEDWASAADFGQPAAALAEALACPVLVVRGAGATDVAAPAGKPALATA